MSQSSQLEVAERHYRVWQAAKHWLQTDFPTTGTNANEASHMDLEVDEALGRVGWRGGPGGWRKGRSHLATALELIVGLGSLSGDADDDQVGAPSNPPSLASDADADADADAWLQESTPVYAERCFELGAWLQYPDQAQVQLDEVSSEVHTHTCTY